MNVRAWLRLGSGGFVLSLSVACAGNAALDRRSLAVQNALHEVEASGALRCAPRELAVARSHVEFAALEREQGFASRAQTHLDVADENVRAARVLAGSPRCAQHDGTPTP